MAADRKRSMAPSKDAQAAKPAFDRELDVRGLTCPMPALRARVALRGMRVGQVLRVVATDRDAPRDLARLAAATGDAIVAQDVGKREVVIYVRKGSATGKAA